MKNVRILFLLIVTIMLATSCLKNQDDIANGTKAEMVISNYVVNNAAFDVSFDNSGITAAPLSFGSGTGSSANLYLKFEAGLHTITLTSGNDAVINNVFSLSANRKYSLFVYDTLKNHSVKALLLEDQIVPVDTIAKGRFFQFIPKDSLTITFTRNSTIPVVGDTMVVSDKYIGTKSISRSTIDFSLLLKPGDYKVDLSRSNLKVFQQPSLTIVAGKVYSFVARGIIGGSGVYKETIAVLQHN